MTRAGDTARRRTGGPVRAPGAALLALGVALAFVAALAALVGAPAVEHATSAPAIDVLLVDTSASVTRTRPGWRRWAVRELAAAARAADDAGHDVAVVTFAGSVKLRWGPSPARSLLEAIRRGSAGPWLRAGSDPASIAISRGPSSSGSRGSSAGTAADLASDLAGATRVALDIVARGAGPPGAVVVLGDGTATGPDPSRLLLGPQFATLRLVAVEPAALRDVGVVGVHAPRAAEPGARIPVEVELSISGPGRRPGAAESIVLEWELRATSAEMMVVSLTARGSESVSVAGGDSGTLWVGFELPPLATGSATLRVRARLGVDARDPFPENDVGTTRFLIGDPVRVLEVIRSDAPELTRAHFRGAAFDGIEFQTIRPAELARELTSATPPDAIVTFDVPLVGLPERELSQFIESGGGWVHCNGWTLLRGDAAELVELVALEPDREPREPRDIVLFVDGSGSMRGDRWERVRAALGELVPSIASSDRLELRFFTRMMGPPQLLFESSSGEQMRPEESERRQAAVRHLMSARVPGGATDIVGSLFELASHRAAANAVPPNETPSEANSAERTGLIILITDGLTDSVTSRRKEVRERLADGGDHVIAIQVGDDRQGTRFLRGLLVEGEVVVQAGELDGLLDILHEAVQDVRLVEGAQVYGAADPIADDWRGETRTVVVAAAGLSTPLLVRRALRCRPVDGAVTLLDFGPGEGVLATLIARGHGTVCGVSVPFLGGGASAWSPGLRRRTHWIAPVLRLMGRRRDAAPDAARGARPTVSLEDGGARLVVRGLPPGLPATIEAVLRLAPTADPFGTLVAGDVIATLTLTTPSIEVEPARVRVGERPGILDRIPRGEVLDLTLSPASMGSSGSLTLVTDGPSELSAGRARAVRAFDLAQRTRPAAAPVAQDGDSRAPPPLTPWLMSAALLGLFLGALGHVWRR